MSLRLKCCYCAKDLEVVLSLKEVASVRPCECLVGETEKHIEEARNDAYWEGFTDHQALMEDEVYREEFMDEFGDSMKLGTNCDLPDISGPKNYSSGPLTSEQIIREALKILHKNVAFNTPKPRKG